MKKRFRRTLANFIAKSAAGRWFADLMPAWRCEAPAEWADDAAEQVRHYNHWVYAAIRATAARVAGTELQLFARRGDNMENISDRNHPFLRLLDDVNPFMTGYGLWESTVMYLELTGNAYWFVAENRLGVPAEIWLVPSQFMRVIPDRKDFIRGYHCRMDGNEAIFDRREIVHLKYPDPNSLYYGRGPLQAAAASVDTHEKLKRAELSAFDNGVLGDLVLESDQQLTQASVDRLRAQVQRKYSGPENAGRALVLEAGLKAKSISLSPREMAFLESSRLTRDEILGIFGVPAAVVGLSEDVNRAVAEAMDVIFTRYCIDPKLRLIESQLNQDLVKRFDERLICRFRSAVPEDRGHDRADMEANLKHGVTTVNEERRRLGLKPVQWGDRPLLPSNYSSLDIEN